MRPPDLMTRLQNHLPEEELVEQRAALFQLHVALIGIRLACSAHLLAVLLHAFIESVVFFSLETYFFHLISVILDRQRQSISRHDEAEMKSRSTNEALCDVHSPAKIILVW